MIVKPCILKLLHSLLDTKSAFDDNRCFLQVSVAHC